LEPIALLSKPPACADTDFGKILPHQHDDLGHFLSATEGS